MLVGSVSWREPKNQNQYLEYNSLMYRTQEGIIGLRLDVKPWCLIVGEVHIRHKINKTRRIKAAGNVDNWNSIGTGN